MTDIIVSATQRPAPHYYGDLWERGADPWHPEAFAGIPGVEKQMREAHDGAARRGGWYALDSFGNAVGWVPDGTVVAQAAAPGEKGHA